MGNSIIANIMKNVKAYGKEEAVRFKHYNSKDWESYSWDEFFNLVRQTSAALLNQGLEKQENVAMYFDDLLEISDEAAHNLAAKRLDEIDGTDLATVIYTSGTTGEPKGVMLTHDNFNEAFKIHDIRININREDNSLCFLPLSHVFERTWSLYVLYKGIKNTYLGDPKEILDAMGEVKPTLMCSVPRLYQKAYHNILAKVRAGSNMKKKLFSNALNAGSAR